MRRTACALALLGALAVQGCTTAPTPAPAQVAPTPARPLVAPRSPPGTRPWVASFDDISGRSTRGPADAKRNPFRVALGALPNTLAVESVSILSSLRDQVRTAHDQVWLLLDGEGDLGLAAGGHRLIPGTIVFVPAGAVHYFTTTPDVESRLLTVVGPDLSREDVFLPDGTRPRAHGPKGEADDDAPAVGQMTASGELVAPALDPGRGTTHGLVVHWDAERKRAAQEVARGGPAAPRLLFAGCYLTLEVAGVAGSLDAPADAGDEALLVIEGPVTPKARLTIEGAAQEVDAGHVALLPAGTRWRLEGGTPRDPVLLLIIRPTAHEAPTSRP